MCHTQCVSESLAHQQTDLVSQKQAELADRAHQANKHFTAARIAVTHNHPNAERVAELLATGNHQLKAAADSTTLSRHEPYDAFNHIGENKSNVWWQAQFSMAEAALRNDDPTPLQREALYTVLKMIVRLTEAESEKPVAEFQDNILLEFGARFLSELSAPQIETGESKNKFMMLFRKARSVFTSFRYALEATNFTLTQLKQERARLVGNAEKMLTLLEQRLPTLP